MFSLTINFFLAVSIQWIKQSHVCLFYVNQARFSLIINFSAASFEKDNQILLTLLLTSRIRNNYNLYDVSALC